MFQKKNRTEKKRLAVMQLRFTNKSNSPLLNLESFLLLLVPLPSQLGTSRLGLWTKKEKRRCKQAKNEKKVHRRKKEKNNAAM